MQYNEDIYTNKLKIVKNAKIFSQNNIVFIRHYDTIIFAYNLDTKECEVKMDCSRTSNKQIWNALCFFGIQKYTDTNILPKWYYSGPSVENTIKEVEN